MKIDVRSINDQRLNRNFPKIYRTTYMMELPCFSPISLFPSIFVQVHMVKSTYELSNRKKSIASTLTAILFLHSWVATKMALEILGYTMCRDAKRFSIKMKIYHMGLIFLYFSIFLLPYFITLFYTYFGQGPYIIGSVNHVLALNMNDQL